MTTKIYRLVEIKNDSEAKFYGNKFFGSKERVQNEIEAACFSLENGGRDPRISDYAGHRWNSIHIEGEGWLTATFCKKVTIDSEMFGEKYHKDFTLGYVTYEVES